MSFLSIYHLTLQRRHNERDSLSNHRRLDYLLNRLLRHRSKIASTLRVTGLCEGNSPVTVEFPVQRAGNAFDDVFMTHSGRDSILQTTFSNSFSGMKSAVFYFLFHWKLSPSVQLTIIQQWFRWLTTSHCMMTSSNGNIFRVTGHLCGKFTGPRWIPRTKASDAELWCFLWSAPD